MFQTISYRAYNPTPVEQVIECGISQEGFADTVAAVKDIVGHSFRTVKINLQNIRKEYVQSDFKQFYSANRSKINLFLKNPARKLHADTFLPMPDGMKGTYPQVCDLLVPFVMLPFGEITKKVIQCTEDLIAITNQEYPREEDRAEAIKSKVQSFQLEDILDHVDALKTTLPKLFAKGKVTSSTVGVQFKDKKQVNEIVDQLLACGDRYKEFIKHQNDVRKLEGNFHKLVDAITKRDRKLKPVEKKVFAGYLYEFVQEMAIFNDYYGIALNEILRVENKFMLCLRQMMEAAKD